MQGIRSLAVVAGNEPWQEKVATYSAERYVFDVDEDADYRGRLSGGE
jgi:hypothetical protein